MWHTMNASIIAIPIQIVPLVNTRAAAAASRLGQRDVLAAQAVMPLPEVGRLVAVLDVGAYGYTESMPFFLSHPVPAEVAIKDGNAQLIRPRIEPRTWLDWQRNPSW